VKRARLDNLAEVKEIIFVLEQKQLSQLVEGLQILNPTRVYLFGSQADGTARQGLSDVDICVVVPDDEEDSYRKSVKAYRSLADFPMPKDIIVRHEGNFRKRSGWQSSIEREVVDHGQLIFGNDG
jgi:predicted nucleotidyltransferase